MAENAGTEDNPAAGADSADEPVDGARRGGRTAVLVALALVAAGGVAWWQLRPSGESAAGDCAGIPPITLTATPDIAEAVQTAATAVSKGCSRVVVEAETDAKVAAAVEKDPLALPTLWIPQSTDWQSAFFAAQANIHTVAPAIASTPVILVGGPDGKTFPSWGAALTSHDVALPDPTADPAGALALTAPIAEARKVGSTVQAAKELLVPVAQQAGEMHADGKKPDTSLSDMTKGTRRLVAVTEQHYLPARVTNGDIRPLVPRTGSPLMRFPLITSGSASPQVLSVASALVSWFRTPDGRAALTKIGLRGEDGTPYGAMPGIGSVPILSEPDADIVAAQLNQWRVTSVPSSLLAVFDASGSMDFASGSSTRMELSAQVAKLALGQFPDHARIGLWVFSIKQGGPRQDWRVLEPTRRLDARVGGTTQRAELTQWADRLPTLTQGGTGLYDTALAAYRQGLRDYSPRYYNTVILLTDGANDDPGSIGENALLAKLKKLQDPHRPVRILGIGISQDADMAALQKIAAATGGKAYQAQQPTDILKVFAQAVLDRD